MLTAKIELEQEDVNPDDNLESEQCQVELQIPYWKDALVTKTPTYLLDERRPPLPLGNSNQQQFPQIKLKRRYRDKENNGIIEEEGRCQHNVLESEEGEEPLKKRSLLEIVEEVTRRRLKYKSTAVYSQRKKFQLSLLADASLKNNNRSINDQNIDCSPPVFEDEETQSIDSISLQTNFSGETRKRLSQEIDWDKLEVCFEEEKEDLGQVQHCPFFNSLFAKRVDKGPLRTYGSSASNRLSLSKHFLQQQPPQSSSDQPQCDITRENKLETYQEHWQGQTEAKCPKFMVGGEDDMSIHQQQLYPLPYTSVSSTSTCYPEVVKASSILLQAAAVVDSGKMSGHQYFTRSKISTLQGRYSLSTATDMAIVASNEVPRNKVNSLQGRIDTGTATEMAIAQSLSEERQNSINSSTAVASPVVINYCTPPSPASLAAAANLNNSLATLCNIGNSCYLNSVLYTLRFAPNFIHNLHHLIEDTDSIYQRLSQHKLKSSSLGRNIPGLHGSSGRSWSSKDLASLGGSLANNSSSSTLSGPMGPANGITGCGQPLIRDENVPPKSNRQVVTEQLHELFQNLHRNEANEAMEPFHAGNILRAVQDVSATFEGNQQQDAHEFLMCVLDSIRESCQALIKTVTDHPDLLITTCPSVPECIEAIVPESKTSGARSFFRRRKDPLKPTKPTSTNGGINALSKGGGDFAGPEQLANLKNALLSKPTATLDEQIVRERLQSLGLDFFRDDFEGITVSKTKCLECETSTEQKETMIDIAIPIAASEVSDAAKNPQLFYQNSCITREYFRGDNKYRCEVCCGYREAIRSISFDVLPRQLILQLKRFNGDMEKINSFIPTPFVLRCFCNTCLPKSDCDKPHIYRLYSVITHVGARMSVGHYIAYTSSLDVHAEYLGCEKDQRRQLLLSGGSIEGSTGSLGGNIGGNASTTGKNSNEKSTSVQLKKLFGSKKASSAGDMSKKIKNNVVNKFNLINGVEGLNINNGTNTSNTLGSSNTVATFVSQSGSNSPNSNGALLGSGGLLPSPCKGLKCCGIHKKNSHLSLHGTSSSVSYTSSSSVMIPVESTSNGFPLEEISTPTEGQMNCINSCVLSNGLSATATSVATFEQSLSQQLWHMCDDDKIKIMTQAEFEELLSPNRRHVITPYLLFYARYDLTQSSRTNDSTLVVVDGSSTSLKVGAVDTTIVD